MHVVADACSSRSMTDRMFGLEVTNDLFHKNQVVCMNIRGLINTITPVLSICGGGGVGIPVSSASFQGGRRGGAGGTEVQECPFHEKL